MARLTIIGHYPKLFARSHPPHAQPHQRMEGNGTLVFNIMASSRSNCWGAVLLAQQQGYLTERMLKYDGGSREPVLLEKIPLLESSLKRLHQRTTRPDEYSKSEIARKFPQHYLWHAPTIRLNISILVFGVAVWTNIIVHPELGPDGYPPRPHAVSRLSHPYHPLLPGSSGANNSSRGPTISGYLSSARHFVFLRGWHGTMTWKGLSEICSMLPRSESRQRFAD